MHETTSSAAPAGAALPVGGPGPALLPRSGEHPGFTLCRVSLALIGVLVVLALTRTHGLPAWTAVTATVCWCVTWAHPGTAVFAGVEAWLLETGFGVHRFGELSFGRPDQLRLALLVTVVVLVALATRGAERVRRAGVAPAEDPGSLR